MKTLFEEINSLGKLSPPFVVIVKTPPEHYSDCVAHSLLKVCKGKECIYVTLNKPYSKVEQELKESNVDTKNIHFIDLVSCLNTALQKDTRACTFIDAPNNMTLLDIAINQELKQTPSTKLIIVDSISTLLVYNKPETAIRFLHDLSSTAYAHGCNAVYFALHGYQEKYLEEISSQFCDKVIEVKKR